MANGDEKSPSWRWLVGILITIIGSGVVLFTSSMMAADAENKLDIGKLKERTTRLEANQASIVEKLESIDKRSERIENKLDRIGK